MSTPAVVVPTAGPYEAARHEAGIWIRGGLGEYIALVVLPERTVSAANAEFLVRAANAHDDLVAALQALGAKPDGYCFCINQAQIAAGHTGECIAAVAAIDKAGAGR